MSWAQLVLLAYPVSLLGNCAFVVVDSWMFQRREIRNLDRVLDDHSAASKDQQTGTLPSYRDKPPIGPDGLIGRIEISRLDLSAAVIEGTGKPTLRRAVGHLPGTALPGQPGGNVGLVGHLDSCFRPLRNIQENDIITLTTLRGEYRYRVMSTRVVTPDQVSVLDPSPDEVLTLVSCHPFYFIGSAQTDSLFAPKG